MKKTVLLLVALTLSLCLHAQEPSKFSPEKFEADMESFITKEVGFTSQEAAKYFPLLREMHQQQRAIYAAMRQQSKPENDKSCEEAIKKLDKMNIQLKAIEQSYHLKMLKVVPASKVYDAIRAENRFHRQMMKGWQKHGDSKGRPRGRRL